LQPFKRQELLAKVMSQLRAVDDAQQQQRQRKVQELQSQSHGGTKQSPPTTESPSPCSCEAARPECIPQSRWAEYQAKGTVADNHERVTVLFSDVVGFTRITDACGPARVVEMLHKVGAAPQPAVH